MLAALQRRYGCVTEASEAGDRTLTSIFSCKFRSSALEETNNLEYISGSDSKLMHSNLSFRERSQGPSYRFPRNNMNSFEPGSLVCLGYNYLAD